MYVFQIVQIMTLENTKKKTRYHQNKFVTFEIHYIIRYKAEN